MPKPIKIDGFEISKSSPCFVIAEAGVNHNGNAQRALELVQKAKDIGADCVKFQTFKAERVATSSAPKARYQLGTTDASQSQIEMLRELELEDQVYTQIVKLCRELNIVFLSTPYSSEDVEFLEALDVPAYKIASGQIVELQFLEHVASKGKPIILSTGMSTLGEIEQAVKVIQGAGNPNLVVLQCHTNYPSQLEDANVRAMKTIRESFGVHVGYSDHVESNLAAFASVTLGARVIEKHFTVDRTLPGPDHSSSLDPKGFTELIEGIRGIEKALGDFLKEPTKVELENRTGMRRSLVAKKLIRKGERLSQESICFKRPATGLSPNQLALVIGKSAAKDIQADTIISYEDIEW